MHLGLTLERNVSRLGEKPVLVFEGRTTSYRQLNAEVNRIANAMIDAGIKKGDKIALIMKNSDEFVKVFYAIMKTGAVAVPVNFRLTASEINYILNDSDSVMAVFDSEFADVISKAAEGIDAIRHKVSAGASKKPGQISLAEFRSTDDSNPDVDISESDDAQILYTSGTTGRPKGALLDHHRVFHVGVNLMAMMAVTPEDRMIHLAPLFHCAELNLFMVLGTFVGCTQVIHKDFNPVDVLKAIEDHKITLFFGVPTMYNFLLQVPNANEFDLSSIRACAYGAAPMPVSLIENSMELFGHDRFYNLCGLTEGGPTGICLTPEGHKIKLGTAGRPIPGTEARIVDENGEDTEPGQIGEFILRGETIMKEYYNKPEETQKALKDGWLYTGDLAVIDEDGYISLVDRKKDMIISGGENIYSTEVEQALYSHPQILEAAVIGVPHEVWGETVAAVIVPKEGQTVDHEEVKEYCRQSLAGYKVPKILYEMEQLPRNASGKVLKYRLRTQYSEDESGGKKVNT